MEHLLHSESLLAPSMHGASTAQQIPACTLDAWGIYCKVNPCLHLRCMEHLLHRESQLASLMHRISTAQQIHAYLHNWTIYCTVIFLLAPVMLGASTAQRIPACTLDTSLGMYCKVNPCLHPRFMEYLLHSESLRAPSMHGASTAQQIPACTLHALSIYCTANPCLHP